MNKLISLPYAYLGGEAGETKDVWGPKAWHWLHLQAINYPENPSKVDRTSMFMRFWSFIHTLPCSECRAHAVSYIQKFPPDFSSSRQFQVWAWRFHNTVNYRLGKPLMTASEYKKTYASEISKSYWQHI